MAARLRDLLFPKLFVESLAEVDLDALASRGITSILLDLDNTILPWRGCEVPPESLEWIKRACEMGMKLFIASNTRNPRRLRSIAEKLDIPCMDKIAKPRRKGLKAAMAEMGSTPEQTAIIGDQIFTDILGGNRLSLYTILVKPMHPREFIGTKISRLFEKPVLAMLARRGMLGTKAPRGESEV